MSETKLCPFCSEEIRSTAIKCKHCSSLLSGEAPRDSEMANPGQSDWTEISGPLPLGTVVENYRVESVVGKGGMGEVYLARHELSQQEVALKVVSPLLMKVGGVAARFLKEAQTMARLHHPNIVQLYNFFEAGGRFFMVMEYLPGRSLKEVLKSGPLDVPEAMRISREVLTGLHYAHTLENPVIHRDIKPDNILLTESGRVVIIDFGVAKALGTEKLTQTGSTVGTCEYMSPEQVMAEGIGPATDQYALGVTLFKMLTGNVPFPQESDSGFEVMRAHIERQPPELGSLRAGLPSWLQEAVARALAKRPDARFSSAKAMAEALESDPLSVDASSLPPQPLVDPHAATRSVPATPAQSPAVSPTARPGIPWGWIGGGLVGLAVIISVVLWAPWQESTDAPSDAGAPSLAAHTPTPPTPPPAQESERPTRSRPAWLADIIPADQGDVVVPDDAPLERVEPTPSPVPPPTEVPAEAVSPEPAKEPVKASEPEPPVPPAPPASTGTNVAGPLCREGMCFVPAGQFTMGCRGQSGEVCHAKEAASRVVDMDAFWLDRTEVTFADYARCVSAGACPPARTADGTCLVPKADRFVKGVLPSQFNGPDRPAICVDWHMADAYCRFEGKALPTEAQWEKGARGDDGRLYPWGRALADCERAVMVDGAAPSALAGRGCRFATTWPVCSRESRSPYGLCDMAGNVWEWVAEDWIASPLGINAGGQVLGDADGARKTMKGGSWTRQAADLRASFRDWDYATTAGSGVGFRCALEGGPDAFDEPELAVDEADPDWALIPAGCFHMGAPVGEPERDDDERLHEVCISTAFQMYRTEVTQGMWRQVVGNNPSGFAGCGDACPLENVTWFEALAFCNELSKAENLERCYTLSGCKKGLGQGMRCQAVDFKGLSCTGYRLPTEAEWEYANRAGSTEAFNTGPCLHTSEANYNGKKPQPGCPSSGNDRQRTVAVGGFEANQWGLFDTHCNVWEWVWDQYAPYPDGRVTDPIGPAGLGERVKRGGAWSRAKYCRSANRYRLAPHKRENNLGFRPVRTVE